MRNETCTIILNVNSSTSIKNSKAAEIVSKQRWEEKRNL